MNDTIVIGGDISLETVLDGDGNLTDLIDGQSDTITVPLGYVGDGVHRITEEDITGEIADTRSQGGIPIVFKANSVSVNEGYVEDGISVTNLFDEMETDTADSVQISYDGTATVLFSPSKHGMAYEASEYILTKENAVGIFNGNFYTPTKQAQLLATQDRYCNSNITILPIPEQYEIYNWMGSQAEFVSTVYPAAEFKLKDTLFNGWSPSTTAKTIKSGATATTFVADMSQYEYMLLWRCDWNVEYSTGYTDVARTLKGASIICQVICRRPNSLANISASNYAGNACVTYRTSPLMEYWNNNGTHTYTYGASYGVYPAATAATFSNATTDNPTVTVKTPAWSARCSTTYFSTGNAGLVDQDKSKFRMKGDLYRMKIGSPEREMLDDLIDLFNNPLTV